MSKMIIGIDPDSKAHGVAVYVNGGLTDLKSMQLLEVHDMLTFGFDGGMKDNCEVHIEDVCANNSAFQKGGIKNAKAATAINRSVGKCQQAQIELERLFEYHEIKVIKHKVSKMWKKDKLQFEKITRWEGRSNEDTRSAAYFGWIGTKKCYGKEKPIQ